MARYLITGATRGIGRALVDVLADDEVIALGRSAETLSGLPVAGRVVADLAEPEGLADLLPVIDRLDGLVHCAGVLQYGPVRQVDIAAWRRSFDLNVVAAAELTRLLLPALRSAAGTVAFVNSGQGIAAAGNLPVYAAAKHAMRALADALRAEEPTLRVCSIFPGRTGTDMQRQLRAAEQETYDEAVYLTPISVATAIAGALRLPTDAVMTDVVVRPRA